MNSLSWTFDRAAGHGPAPQPERRAFKLVIPACLLAGIREFIRNRENPVRRIGAIATLCLAAAVSSAAGKPPSEIGPTDFDGRLAGARYIGFGALGTMLRGGPQSPLWNPATLHDVHTSMFSIDTDLALQSRLEQDVLTSPSSLRGRKLTYLGFAARDAAFFYRPLSALDETTVTVATDAANNFDRDVLSVQQFGVSVAQESSSGFALGLNLSYLNGRRGLAHAATGTAPRLDMADGSGYTVDFGVRYHSEVFAAGAAVFNWPGVIYWNRFSADRLPTEVRVGGAYSPIPQATLAAEYQKRFYRQGHPRASVKHVGFELTPFEWAQLRVGAYGEDLNDAAKTTYTAGFSVYSSRRYALDVAGQRYRQDDQSVTQYNVSLVVPMVAANP